MKCPNCQCELKLVKTEHQAVSPAVQADTSEIETLLIQAEQSNLNEWGQKFVSDVRERFEQYGSRIRMSEKQMAALKKLALGDYDEF